MCLKYGCFCSGAKVNIFFILEKCINFTARNINVEIKIMKSFLFAIVAVLFCLNCYGQSLKVDGDPFGSCSICMECSFDNNGKQCSRIILTSNLPLNQLNVKGAIIVSQKEEVGMKIIEFLPNHGQKITFYATQCQPLDVVVSEFVTGGAEYKMHIVGETNGVVEPVVNVVSEPVVEPTPPSSTSIGGHEYVDLGLPSGTLWATCNIGANSPEEYGDYFAWGETSPKSNYKWSTLKYCEDDNGDTYSKYNTDSKYGNVDNKTTLERSDDAATANWGNDWCMPTLAQFQELYDKCTWTWTKKNGKKGYEVKGSNGNTIFRFIGQIAG
jgi:hypothetical protein